MQLAGIGFDWLTFFDAPTALKIVGGLNFLGIMSKAWIATAEQMAKSMTATAATTSATAATAQTAGDA